MFARTLILTAALLVTTTATAHAGPVPRALRGLKPHQVVETIMAQREGLNLTEQQFVQLDDISLAVRNEKHRFTHQGGKPHSTQHVPMISREEAFELAMAVLTPEQQQRVQALFQVAPATPRTERPYTRPHGKP